MAPNPHRRSQTLCVLLLFTFVFQSTSFAQSTDEALVKSIVENYFAAYAREDLDAITLLWSTKSPDLTQTKARLKEVFSLNDRIEVHSLKLRRLKVEGDRASTVAAVELSGIDAKTGKPAAGLGKMNRAISFVQQSGEWKIVRDIQAEEELAARLVGAKSDGERQALVSEDPLLTTPDLVRALANEGQKYYNRGSYPEALVPLRLSYQIAEQIGDKPGTGRTLLFTGHVYNLMGDYDTALDYYDRVIKTSEAIGYRGGVARALLSIGSIQEARGQLSFALASDIQALSEFEAAGDKRNTALALNNLGVIYFALKNYEQSAEYYLKALPLFEELRDESLLAPLLNNIGNAHAIQGDYVSARKYHERSLALNEKFGDRRSAATVLNSIGDTLLQEGKPDEALEYFQKSLKIKEEIGSRGTTFSLNDIASAYYARGDFEKALEPANRAAAMALQMGSEEQYWWARSTAGKAYLALHKTADARHAFEDAIASSESLRKLTPGVESEQQRFFEDRVLPYYQMIGMLVAENELAGALSYAERAKARVLLDVLQNGRAQISKAMNDGERERERRLRTELNSLNAQLQRESQSVKTDQPPIEALKAKLVQARLSYEGFQIQLYAAHPDLRVKRGEAQPLSLEQAAELLTGPRDALLEYAVTGDRTFLFVLTESPQKGLQRPILRCYELNIRRKDLVEQVQKLNQRIANHDLEYINLSGELYKLLIAPARQQLQGKSRLVIVPDDILWEIPFQALRSPDGRFLIQDAAISYAQSLTVLRELVKSQRARSATTLLAMGNPKLAGQTISRSKNVLAGASFEPLPEAERMVMRLRQMYGAKAKVYIGAEAREDLFKAEAANYRILQLSTHGVINNASPMYSHLILAPGNDAKEDGLLEAWEIMQLDLKADLAVLSACETARGKIGAGEGVIGLAWALFVAGCPTTVVSQWKVESSSTAELMLAFHGNLQAGLDKSEALRQASIKLMSDKRYSHPFYWAGFIVVGDPK